MGRILLLAVRQALYAETLMTYEEFNQMFGKFRDHYWRVRIISEILPLTLQYPGKKAASLVSGGLPRGV